MEKGFDNDNYSLVFKSPREVNKILFQIRKSRLLWVDLRGDKHICHYNANHLPFEHNFYGLDSKDSEKNILYCAILNSSLSWFFIEVLGRRGLGVGAGAIRLVRIDIK